MRNFSKLVAGAALLCATSAQAVELPGWDIARLCTSDSSSGQCRLFESEARRTLLGGWAVLPEAYRSACLEEIKEPDVSYRTLSQCLEQQVLKGRQLRVIGTATTAPVEAAVPDGSVHHKDPVPDAATAPKMETLEDYIKQRENWGTGKGSSLARKEIRIAAATSIPSRLGQGKKTASDALPPVHHVAETSPPSQVTEVPRAEIDKRLEELLSERESWGSEPSMKSATVGTETVALAASSEAEPADLAGYLARRDGWGSGSPPKEVKAPLAAGAVTPLPSAAAAPAAEGPAPIIHPPEETPPAQLTEIPRSEIEGALADLLAEREGWGTEPSAAVAEAPAEPSAPAADAEATPAPQIAEVPRADIDKALAELLSERESWGTGPSASGLQMAARAPDLTTCEAGLREAIGENTILFRSGSAVLDGASYPILNELAERAKGCGNASIHVEGHTDDLGSETANQVLSEQRAMAVVNYLVQGGVDSNRVEAIGFGKSRPLVPNTTAENRAKNRRIEFSVR